MRIKQINGRFWTKNNEGCRCSVTTPCVAQLLVRNRKNGKREEMRERKSELGLRVKWCLSAEDVHSVAALEVVPLQLLLQRRRSCKRRRRREDAWKKRTSRSEKVTQWFNVSYRHHFVLALALKYFFIEHCHLLTCFRLNLSISLESLSVCSNQCYCHCHRCVSSASWPSLSLTLGH